MLNINKEDYIAEGIHFTKHHLAIIGLSIGGEDDISVHSLNILKNANLIVCLEPKDQFREAYGSDWLRDKEILSMDFNFWKEDSRNHALKKIADSICRLCITLPGVVFALSGNPNVAVSPTQWIKRMAKDMGITCDIRPGISSIDYFICDTGIDVTHEGCQITNAGNADKLSGNMPFLLLSPGYADKPDMSEKYKQLIKIQTALLKTYGPHSRGILYTRFKNSFQSAVVDLSELADKIGRMKIGGVLIYGPVK